MSAAASVEPEDKLVEVERHVVPPNAALMRAQHPALEKRGDPMDAGQDPGGLGAWGHGGDVLVGRVAQGSSVARPAVRVDGRAGLDVGIDECPQVAGVRAGQHTHPTAPEAGAGHTLNGYPYQDFRARGTTTKSLSETPEEGLVHLDLARKAGAVLVGSCHAELGEHCPGGLVAVQIELAF